MSAHDKAVEATARSFWPAFDENPHLHPDMISSIANVVTTYFRHMREIDWCGEHQPKENRDEA